MTEQEIIKTLKLEGFDKVWIYDAEPNEIDAEHSHDYDTKLHIVSGEIRIKKMMGGAVTDFLLKKDDQIEIPRNQSHSAKVGVEGCCYIVAERHH